MPQRKIIDNICAIFSLTETINDIRRVRSGREVFFDFALALVVGVCLGGCVAYVGGQIV